MADGGWLMKGEQAKECPAPNSEVVVMSPKGMG